MEAFVGTILTFGFNFAPSQWALCNGQTIAISQNAALFSLLGTTYGGNGVNTFQLPNLQSRMPIGMGQGLGLSQYVIGQVAGTESVTLTNQNLPSHTHVATFTPSGGGGPVSVTINASTNTTGNSNIPTTANNVIGGTPTAGAGATHIWAAANSGTVPIGGVTVSGGGGGGTVTNALTGNGLPTQILNPYLALNFSISMFGIFPSRN